MINYEYFSQIDLRVGTIVSASRVDGSDKLLKLSVDIGELKQIIAGIGKTYTPEELIDEQIVIINNLEPRLLMGLESQGMLLAADNETGPIILTVKNKVKSGSKIK